MKPFRAKAVLFDFDGTLSRPDALDFRTIKEELGCPPDKPVLEFIEEKGDPAERTRAMERLHAFERLGAERSIPNAGAEACVHRLRQRGLGVGILTRNSRSAVRTALENFTRLSESDFDVTVTRDDPAAPKPSPEGIRLAAERLGVNPDEIVMVGDFVFDVDAAVRAGAVSVFLSNEGDEDPGDADFTITDLSELEEVLRWGLPLRNGKLPNDLLQRFLSEFGFEDPSLLVRPGVGEDTAAVRLDGSDVLVVTADPITFATDAIGWYTAVVNANDMATSGAVPRWLATTLLLPPGTTPSQVHRILSELQAACRKWAIVPCGGHTEITDAVNRPVVAATLMGTADRGGLLDKKAMRPGDAVLMTKSAGLEGTAIAAVEFRDRLAALGMDESRRLRCREALERIGVMEEARIAAASSGTRALHDVTEGGVATALAELSAAGGYGIRVNLDRIPVLEETREVCRLLEMDPLGLIGSGSLLICCRSDAEQGLLEDIRAAGVPAVRIGKVVDAPAGVRAYRGETEVDMPVFEVDEITKLF